MPAELDGDQELGLMVIPIPDLMLMDHVDEGNPDDDDQDEGFLDDEDMRWFGWEGNIFYKKYFNYINWCCVV